VSDIPQRPHSERPHLERSHLEEALKLCFRLFQWAFAICIFAFLFSGVHTVPQGQVAKIQRFGKWLPDIEQPGLHFAWPSFMDRVVLFDLQQLQKCELLDFAPASASLVGRTDRALLTAEGQLIHSSWTVYYRLDDPTSYFDNFGHGNTASVRDHVASLLKASVIAQTASVGIDELLQQSSLSKTVHQDLQQRLDQMSSGMVVASCSLDAVSVPSSTQQSFETVQNELLSQDQRRQRATNQARQKQQQLLAAKNVAIGNAKTEAQRRQSRWQAEAENLKGLLHQVSPSTLNTWFQLKRETIISQALTQNKDQTFWVQQGGELRLQLSKDPHIDRLRREQEETP
jgi:regulator of protease activity HflC (stomatin/prohibitin superfamily)